VSVDGELDDTTLSQLAHVAHAIKDMPSIDRLQLLAELVETLPPRDRATAVRKAFRLCGFKPQQARSQ
jgi:hypothetical protein